MKIKRPSSFVKFSRVIGLLDAIALGVSISVGLVFVLSDRLFELNAKEGPFVFLVAAIVFFPVILSFSEYSRVSRGSGSFYKLAREAYSGGITRFAIGWLMVGGYIALGCLFAQGVALRLSIGLERFFGLELQSFWLVIVVLILAGLKAIISPHGYWRAKTVIVWGALIILIVGIIWAVSRLFSVTPVDTTVYELKHWLREVGLVAALLWNIDLFFHKRNQLREPEKNIFPVLAISWLLATVIGFAGIYVGTYNRSLPIYNWATALFWQENRLELLILVTGVMFCWIGLGRAISGSIRSTGSMARDGYFPKKWAVVEQNMRAPLSQIAIFILVMILCSIQIPSFTLSKVAAVTFLWVVPPILIPFTKKSRKSFSKAGKPRLSLHPLFPILAITSCVFFSLVLPGLGLVVGSGWLAIGLFYYIINGRHGRVVVEREEYIVAESEAEISVSDFSVLVAVSDETDTSLINAGQSIARAHNGTLFVLRVLPSTDQFSEGIIHQIAEKIWQDLDRLIKTIHQNEVSIFPCVRISPDVTSGIIGATAEYNANIVLIGWADDTGRKESESMLLAENLFEATDRPLAVIRGILPERPESVLISVVRESNAVDALKLGHDLVATSHGKVKLVTAVRAHASWTEGSELLSRTIEDAGLGGLVEEKLIQKPNIKEGILEEANLHDLLLIGASVDPIFGRGFFGGLPVDIAKERQGPTVLVKGAEKRKMFLVRRLLEILSKPFPSLTIQARAGLSRKMRESARASVDFYTLICLASAIAMLGLILNSGAVIIGGMLVAPLMSPILATAHGIVVADLFMIRQGIASTFKGIGAAIGVGILITLVIPSYQPTHEILARVEPSILDLLVALASGAAGAYAMGIRSVSAALPGVAISAALVPPLCVVGYGIGSSLFRIAGGALLLFITNLIAITFISTIVFLLIGLRPSHTRQKYRVSKAILIVTVSIVILVVPLGLATYSSINKARVKEKVERILQDMGKDRFDFEGLTIKKRGKRFDISVIIMAYKDFSQKYLEEVRSRIRKRAGIPVSIQATIVPASIVQAGQGNFRDRGERLRVGDKRD